MVVLGYHGCDQAVADGAVMGKRDLLQSNNNYDWLGPGTYFWESDPTRAMEWAQSMAKRGKIQRPAVVGAVIDLRNCLDLVARENLELVKVAYNSFVQSQRAAGLEIPQNESVEGTSDPDQMKRYLDCAVIRHLHFMIDDDDSSLKIEPFDTVRGMFREGKRLYPTSGFRLKNHIQIAVHKAECIVGLFHPRFP